MPNVPHRQTGITEFEEHFLIAEFNQCWTVISAIDERRGKFLQSITTIVVAAIGALGFLLTNEKGCLPLSRVIEAIGLLGFSFIGCLIINNVLRSERAANIRYRKKANLIRSILLKDSKSLKIQDYITNHKEIGIVIPGDAQEPKGSGRTLNLVFLLLIVEMIGLIMAGGYVIARYYGYFSG